MMYSYTFRDMMHAKTDKMGYNSITFIFILAIGKNICQRKLFVWYHRSTTPLFNCYSTSQFYHKPVGSCFILLKKECCIYAASVVSQTPIFKIHRKESRHYNDIFLH